MSCEGQSCCSCPGRPSEWSALTAPEFEVLTKGIRARIFHPGESLYLQGNRCEGIHCLQWGLIGIRRVDQAGESALLRLARGGDVLGYNALLLDGVYLESAEVLATSKICFIGKWLILPMLRGNADLTHAFLRRALTDMTRLEEEYANLLTRTLKSRLLRLLVSLHRQISAPASADASSFELPIQRKELAALLGATPESVSRVIGRLNAEGAVRIKERQVEIRDPDRAMNGALYEG